MKTTHAHHLREHVLRDASISSSHAALYLHLSERLEGLIEALDARLQLEVTEIATKAALDALEQRKLVNRVKRVSSRLWRRNKWLT